MTQRATAQRASMTMTLYRALHAMSFYLLSAIAVVLVAYSAACAAGIAPWLTLQVTLGETTYAGAGPLVQLGVTLVVALLFFFMPAANRIMALERSHRDFRMTMDDVTRAYYAAHAGDRAGMFTLSSEFDAVRERIAFLREHPDLEHLEPQVLELAAQMSQQSRDLAEIYSDEKVARAKTFLRQRQEEAETQQEHITQALHVLSEIRQWQAQVEAEESIVAAQLDQLFDQMEEVLPPLGLHVIEQKRSPGVTQIKHARPAAE